MDPHTILKPVACDLKKLPLGALEAFLLSQLDGQLDLEELAEVMGLDPSEVQRLAKLLLDLGAVSTSNSRPPASKAHGAGAVRRTPAEESRSARVDPRAESTSLRPDPRAETHSVRPATVKQPTRHPTPRPVPRRSHKSLSMQRVAPSRAEPGGANDVCELDAATLSAIAALDAKLGKVDHYALLEVERGADKKAIKRAYFAFASRFHPDRFFGKKLGATRTEIDRIFQRLTAAHDTLTDAKRRTDYDATLAPAPAPARPPSRKMSKAMRASSRQMKAARALSTTPGPPVERVPVEQQSVRSLRTDEKRRDLGIGAIEARVQARVDLLVKAGEEALEAKDVAGAANSFRLALEHREDPRIRMIFEDVDARARALRFEKNGVLARAAEREQRWADAAVFLVRAHEAKQDCDVASRAAKALRLSGGNLDRAAELAELAVALAPRNAAYRVTLAEIYLGASRPERAAEECATARGLAPKDEHVKALMAEIARRAKATDG